MLILDSEMMYLIGSKSFNTHIILYDVRVGLWECVARNNPLASLLGVFDPNIFYIEERDVII